MTPNGMGTLLFWFYSKLPFICLNPPSSADLTALRRAFKRQVTERVRSLVRFGPDSHSIEPLYLYLSMSLVASCIFVSLLKCQLSDS